jgi:hypothetical protein
MRFILLQNQNIVPGTRWVLWINTDDPKQPTFAAMVREFETEILARQFLQHESGVLVPGKPWALIFSGIAENTHCPITINFQDEVASFMEDAAQWLSIL